MKHIEVIAEFNLGSPTIQSKDKEMNELFNGPFRRIVEVRLQNNAVLSRHHADVPITVLCLSGTGMFTAGKDLEDSQEFRPGTFITLAAGVEHEVSANPALHILVTKFKAS